MIAGRKDALALLGISGGFLASIPWFVINHTALPLLLASALGATYLSRKMLLPFIDRIDISSRENFVLPSDEVFPQSMGRDGIRFGMTKDKNLPVDIADKYMMRHTAIIGQSGVGKTTQGEYLLWQQIVRGAGWIFIDAKLDKDTLNKMAWMAGRMGRELEFHVLNVDDPDNSHSYNPLLNGDADEIASRLLNLIPASETNPGADHYRQMANHALTVIIAALQAANFQYHFGDLTVLLQSPSALARLEQMTPAGSEKRALQIFLDQFKRPTKNGNCIDAKRLKETLGGICGRLAVFAQGKFGRVFNTYSPQIDFTDIIVNNKLLYIMLPTMGKDTAALNLGKMIMSDIRSAVANIQAMPKSKRPDPAFMIFADEMGSYVMPGIARLFEQARSANIALIPSFQSFSNLSAVSPEFADMIIQNNWNKVFFKFGSKDSSEIAAEIIGKHIRYQKQINVSESVSNSTRLLRVAPDASLADGGSTAKSWKENETFRVSPDQLKSLDIGEAIVMSGARMFHVSTPMLEFEDKIPDFKVTQYKASIAKGKRRLEFEKNYQKFRKQV